VHNMLELGAGQCTPSPKPASQRRDLQQGEASASFGKKFSRTELFSEKSTCGAKIKLQGATVSVLLICFSQLGERELIQFLLILVAVKTPTLDLFWLAPAKVILRNLERDELN